MEYPVHTTVERKVLKRITPPTRPPAIIKSTLAKVQAALAKLQVQATVVMGGSLAKGTYLKGDHDIDVFVRFAASYKDEELADLLQSVMRKVFRKIERVHGSRDYFHVYVGTYLFEFIPVLNISSWVEARNVTDMSPLHVDYVRHHVNGRPWLSGEIRLTKQFCKAAKVYGAESYIGGFSGHVIDLLNIHYGGFRKLLTAAASWPAKVVIDPEAHYTNPLEQLNDAKTLAPLVIVDPIQQDRNSAAALSHDAFRRFRIAAREYLAAGNEQFFTIVPLTDAQMAKEYADARIIIVKLKPLKGKKDVIGAKCYKVFAHFVQQLLEHGFKLQASRWEFSQKQALLLFALPKDPLPSQFAVEGPPIHMTLSVANFKRLHKETFTKEQRIYALERVKFRDAKVLLVALQRGAYVQERVKAVAIAEFRRKK